MNAEIKIRFLREVRAPQQVWHTRCECCGPHFDGYQDSLFLKDEELNPDEQYNKVDLRKLVLGTDYAIIEFVPDAPSEW